MTILNVASEVVIRSSYHASGTARQSPPYLPDNTTAALVVIVADHWRFCSPEAPHEH